MQSKITNFLINKSAKLANFYHGQTDQFAFGQCGECQLVEVKGRAGLCVGEIGMQTFGREIGHQQRLNKGPQCFQSLPPAQRAPFYPRNTCCPFALLVSTAAIT